MSKYFLLTGFVLVLAGCRGDKDKNNTAEQEKAAETTEQAEEVKVPEFWQFGETEQEELAAWEQYTAFSTAIKDYAAEEEGDLLMQIDNILEKEKELSDSGFPQKFNHPSVKSRLSVVNTFLLQTRLEAPEPVTDAFRLRQKFRILVAFYNLERQLDERMATNLADEYLDETANIPLGKRDTLYQDSISQEKVDTMNTVK
ncbi:hypothetical protein [Sinomicrobium soli]|uniref:hypothetical protein n=1 Tax=Sinomicrobium sp. N-1-3-6 TaxID=2219864 RepID=UPI0011BE7775|nr:hypothetical protein [Sinomicrobium sp. N-1-3-6]